MSNTSVGTGRDHTNEIRRLSTLLEVSQALSGVLNLKAALQSVLDLLERRHQVTGGTIFLLDADTRELHVEATVGTRLGVQRARVRPGDGITERVIDTGKPVVVPRASQEPALAAAAGERARGRELTYLAVPIAVGRRPGGTLEVVLTYKQDRDYQRSLEFYRVVASMIAQAFKLRRSGRGRPQQAWRKRTNTSATSCATSTRSAASSATAPRFSRSTNRWRRWRAPTPRR